MVVTDLNSAFKMLDSVIRNQKAILPSLVYYEEHGSTSTKTAAKELREAVTGSSFRHCTHLGRDVLEVVSKELDKMKNTSARLSMILPAIYKIWAALGGASKEGGEMLHKLNCRLNKWNVDLLIFATSLDPKYQLRLFNQAALDEFKIVDLAKSYYEQVFGQEPQLDLPLLCYLTVFEDFVPGMNYEECRQKPTHLSAYWEMAAKRPHNHDLLKFMRHIERIVPNSAASGERLFSSLEFIHSQGRHKLLPETLLKLARIRSYFLEEVKREDSYRPNINDALRYFNEVSLYGITDNESDDDESRENVDDSEHSANSDDEAERSESEIHSDLMLQEEKEENEFMQQVNKEDIEILENTLKAHESPDQLR